MKEKNPKFSMFANVAKWQISRKLYPCVLAVASIFSATELSAKNVTPTIVGGTATSAPEAIGYLTTSAGLLCTATLISPNHILTASHCNSYRAHDVNIGEFTAQVRVPGGGLANITRKVKLWIGQGAAVGEDDWGIGVLESPIDNITPARISARQPSYGETVTAFGYGCTNRNPKGGTWEKRYRQFTFGTVPKLLCPGDSGGPLMIGTVTNAVEIVGVNSGFNGSGVDIWASAVKYREHITAIPQKMPTGNVCYRAHVAVLGWLPLVCDGSTGGTIGKQRRMEAIQVYAKTGSVCYTSHLAGIGWEGSYKCNGEVSGTVGQRRQMEAFQISTSSRPLMFMSRAHVAGLGWLTWVDKGFIAGTTGQRRQLEALEIKAY